MMNIQEKGALIILKLKAEKDFEEIHVDNEIINMSSGDVADYKLNWMNTRAKNTKMSLKNIKELIKV